MSFCPCACIGIINIFIIILFLLASTQMYRIQLTEHVLCTCLSANIAYASPYPASAK